MQCNFKQNMSHYKQNLQEEKIQVRQSRDVLQVLNFIMCNSLIIKKMKKILLSAITVIATGAFVSCNQNEDGIDNINPDSRKEVNFSSNITKVSLPTTRAGGIEWEENDEIGVFMFEMLTHNIVEDKSNIEYVTMDGGVKGTFVPGSGTTIFFPDNGDKVRFMSYYPYTASISNYIYPIDVSNQTKQADIDLLHSFADTTFYDKAADNKKVTLVFNHKLTKININVKPGEGLTPGDLANIDVTFKGFFTTANFNLITGDISNQDAIGTITPLGVTPIDDYYFSYESIVLPMKNPGTASIKFDLNNGNESEGISNDVFTWNFKNETELKGGYEYIYNVTVKRSGIVVEAIINEWLDGGEEDINAE